MKKYWGIVLILVTACVPMQGETIDESGQREITDENGVEMVFVPAGDFIMGSDAECQTYRDEEVCSEDWAVRAFSLEHPPHEVSLAAFYIDKYEVTNAHYKTCVDEGVCNTPKKNSNGSRVSYYGNSEYDNYPVVYVDWDMARVYCEWRGARLPSEAEWEKAARGTDGRTYPWGNEFDGSLANFCDKSCPAEWTNKEYDDGYLETAPVGNYPEGVSPYGVHDLAGNVWEWVSSALAPYPYDAEDGREDINISPMRVLRGGSFGEEAFYLRTTERIQDGKNNTNLFVGFRCARDEP